MAENDDNLKPIGPYALYPNDDPFEVQQKKRKRDWHTNHQAILAVVTGFLYDIKRMPTDTEIAEQTGLSQRTVQRHLREYKESPRYKELLNGIEMLKVQILATLGRHATQGDERPAKIFLDYFVKQDQIQLEREKLQLQREKIKTQNLIQINGVTININDLPKEKRELIDKVIEDIPRAANEIKVEAKK